MKNKKKSGIFTVLSLGAAALFALIVSGCDNFSFYTLLDGADNLRITAELEMEPAELTITPAGVLIPVNMNYTFSAAGGTAPYEFAVKEGGGSIEPLTGIFTAPPAPGPSKVTVTDSAGTSATATVDTILPGEFTISPRAILLYVNNTAVFSAVGGIAPFTFSVVSGSGTIDAETGLYKAPGSAGTDIVRVTGAQNNWSDAEVTIITPFKLSPSSITVVINNSYPFTASGGKPPYTFSVTPGGTIDPATGNYTAPGSTGTDTVTAGDALGNTQTATVHIIPLAGPLLISPATAVITQGSTLAFSASGGTGSYTFSLYSGIGSVVLVTYTAPDAPGTGSAVVRVTDGTSVSDASVTVVDFGPLSISPATGAVVEQNTVQYFTGVGGVPPYTYSVVSGGGSINSSTGGFTPPSALGSVTVRVTDSLLDTAVSTVSIAPAVPTNIAADSTPANPSDITLTWTDNATGEDGFKIERKEVGGVFAEITPPPPPPPVLPDVELFVDSACTPNKVYVYRIRAYAGTVHSAYSAEVYSYSNQ